MELICTIYTKIKDIHVLHIVLPLCNDYRASYKYSEFSAIMDVASYSRCMYTSACLIPVIREENNWQVEGSDILI